MYFIYNNANLVFWTKFVKSKRIKFMQNAINQRIKFLREKLNLSQIDFSKRLKVSQSRIAKIETGRVDVDITFLSHIALELNINRDWLLTGQGEMYLTDATQSNLKILTTTVDDTSNEKIVLVPEKAEAGYLKSFEHEGLMIDFLKNLPVISLPGNEYHNASFRAFEVSGHSMEPTFYVRDIVVCRYIEHYSYIRNKEVYVIVTRNEGIVIKRVVKKENTLELHSDNEDFEPYSINLEDIVEIWKFEAKISKVAPMPRSRLKAIEDGLHAVQQQLILQFKILNDKK